MRIRRTFVDPLPPGVRRAVTELKQALQGLYGERLAGLYLYGSYARGDFRPDADVDLLELLHRGVKPCEEIDRLSPVASEICLRQEVFLSVLPVPAAWLAAAKAPSICGCAGRVGPYDQGRGNQPDVGQGPELSSLR